MKSRKPLLALLAAGSMTLAGSLLAQNQGMQATPPPPPAPAAPMPATPPPAPAAPMPATTPPPPPSTPATPTPVPRSTVPTTAGAPSAPAATMPAATPTPAPPAGTQANINSPQGQVTINSSVPPVVAGPGPAPSFEQLSGGSRFITEDQAAAYPLLANDFLYVDKGHTGHITKAQYERWLNNNK